MMIFSIQEKCLLLEQRTSCVTKVGLYSLTIILGYTLVVLNPPYSMTLKLLYTAGMNIQSLV